MRAGSVWVQRMATMGTASDLLLQVLPAQLVDRAQFPRRGVTVVPERPAVGLRIGPAGWRPDHRFARYAASGGQGLATLFGVAHAETVAEIQGAVDD